MQKVFVLDRHKQPLMPCRPARARQMLKNGRAVVHRVAPFTIRLKQRVGGNTQPLRLKIDPGSKATGMVMVREEPAAGSRSVVVLNLIEVRHRGQRISLKLAARSRMRRRRRSSNLRYRAVRFLNRTKPAGWLAPSLQHRVDTTMAWVKRLRRLAPVTDISSELVCFDMQALENPEIEGAEYQQGTLGGYEVREYLLEKWGRHCAYCDARDVPLTIDHIRPKARGGSNRISNLTLACVGCNQEKGKQPVEVFLAGKPERLARILAQAKCPLKDAAAVNATRWALARRLQATGLPVELASGGRTKYNRSRFGIPKTHALDAACVGVVDQVDGWQLPATLVIGCTGRGGYQRTQIDKYGFPRGYLMRTKRVFGFQTGDHVRADVPTGKNAGIHIGRVAVRSRGSFNVRTISALIRDVPYRYCRRLQRADGYAYTQTTTPKG